MFRIKLKSEYNDLDKIENQFGIIIYYKKNTNIRHNPYGPAYITKNESKFYYIEGKCHKLDGPARIYGGGLQEYWINDKKLTKEEFEIHPERLEFLGKGHLACLA